MEVSTESMHTSDPGTIESIPKGNACTDAPEEKFKMDHSSAACNSPKLKKKKIPNADDP